MAGIVGMKDELLCGVGSGVEEDVLEEEGYSVRLFKCSVPDMQRSAQVLVRVLVTFVPVS